MVNLLQGESNKTKIPCVVILLGHFILLLEGAARYAGLLLAPAEGFGLRPRPSADSFFCPSGKKNLFMSVLAQILVIFGDQS